jgi:hypothetical protein
MGDDDVEDRDHDQRPDQAEFDNVGFGGIIRLIVGMHRHCPVMGLTIGIMLARH